MKIQNPRTYMELRVGDHSIVEVILNIHRSHISWFNSTEGTNERTAGTGGNSRIFRILLHMIQTSILPRMFSDEIENNYYTSMGRSIPYPELGPGGIPIPMPVGAKSTGTYNNATSTKLNDISINIPNMKKKGLSYNNKRGRKMMSKVKIAEMKRIEQEQLRQQRLNDKEIYYATSACSSTFDESSNNASDNDNNDDSNNEIQVAYQFETLPKYGYATTLVFTNQNDKNNENHHSNLIALKKLQRRLILWCYPLSLVSLDSNDTTQTSVIATKSKTAPATYTKTNISDIFQWNRPEMLPIILPPKK